MPRRSIGFPLTLGSVLILLVIALAAGWLVLLMNDVGASRLNPGLTTLDWILLILGTAALISPIATEPRQIRIGLI